MALAGAEATGLTGWRVLVVEDEFYIAADLTDALRDAGAEILGPVATTGEARALLDGARPVHMALLDVNLQGELVHPLADLLTERGIPFAFTTGYDTAALPKRFREVPRWEKPFDPRSVARALPSLLPWWRGVGPEGVAHGVAGAG